MVYEVREKTIDGLDGTSLKRYALLMEDKMVVGAFGWATNFG